MMCVLLKDAMVMLLRNFWPNAMLLMTIFVYLFRSPHHF
jgi:hypothetical protein